MKTRRIVTAILSLLFAQSHLRAEEIPNPDEQAPPTAPERIIVEVQGADGLVSNYVPEIIEDVRENEKLIGINVADDVTINGQTMSGIIALTAQQGISFTSMTGVILEENLSPDTPVFLLQADNLKVDMVTTAGVSGAPQVETAGDIIGFQYLGSKHHLGRDLNSTVRVLSQAHHKVGSRIVGAEIANARIDEIVLSNMFVNASHDTSLTSASTLPAVRTEIETTAARLAAFREEAQGQRSADDIVGLRIGSGRSVTNNEVNVIAHSRDTGTVVGFDITGAFSTSADNYLTDVNIINTGGVSTGVRISNANVNTYSGAAQITALNSTGFIVSNSNITELSARVEIRDDTKNARGIVLTPKTDGTRNVESLKSTIKIFNDYELIDNDSALVVGYIDDFGSFTQSDSVFTGLYSGTGMDLTADFTDSTVQSSGFIDAKVTVVTDSAFITSDTAPNNPVLGTYIVDGTELELTHRPDGNIVKSNVAIKVESVLPDGFSGESTAELNFGTNAEISADIKEPGRPEVIAAYGDVLNYDSDNIVLNSTKSVGSASNETNLRGDISYSGDDIANAELQYRTGNFNVSSDYWHAGTVAFGDAADQTVSQVNLLDSTSLASTSRLLFHVNSVDEHSLLNVADGKKVTISEVSNIDITLSTDFLATAPDATVTLIDGEILDAAGGEISFTLNFVDEDGIISTTAPEDYYIIYHGVDYLYTPGLTITLTGASTDLVIGGFGGSDTPDIEGVPEPSSAVLSVLALAAFTLRRRRPSVIVKN